MDGTASISSSCNAASIARVSCSATVKSPVAPCRILGTCWRAVDFVAERIGIVLAPSAKYPVEFDVDRSSRITFQIHGQDRINNCRPSRDAVLDVKLDQTAGIVTDNQKFTLSVTAIRVILVDRGVLEGLDLKSYRTQKLA